MRYDANGQEWTAELRFPPLQAGECEDIFVGSFGYADQMRSVYGVAAQARDFQLDKALEAALQNRALLARLKPRNPGARDVLILVVTSIRYRYRAQRIAAALNSNSGPVIIIVDERKLPKFTKVNLALAQARQVGISFRWFVIIDDDVAVPAGFLDRFLDASESVGLILAQPAHRFHSYAAYAVTQRAPCSLVRATNYVEGGPIVGMHYSILPDLTPFPEPRWAWGVDFLWSDQARRRGWPIGVVDAATFEHLRPIARNYSGQDAMQDTRALLTLHGFNTSRRYLLDPGRIALGW